MKIQKDVAYALASVAAIIVALFAAFVTIPVWFEAVIITLAVIGVCFTVSEIVKAHRASYDEEEGVYTYRFPVRAFLVGIIVLVATAAVILLSLMRLFGFALIPFVILLALLFAIACLKRMTALKWIVGLLIAILVVVFVSYFAGTIVNNDVDLNPGISTETTAPETQAPETTEPEVQEPELKEDEDEGKPVIPEETKPEETKPEETKPEETKPEETKPEETKPEETKPEETKPEETKPEETKPEETKPEETKPEETKPEEVKINAPKTMSYAEPITVTLEGCKAKDLRYTDEAFYSIVVVSETEVQITLVGIVNDAGEVELIPVSRRLEICDCVSGEYVIIDIVDNNETTEPEIKADEEEEVDTPVEDIEKPEGTKPEETKPEEVKINAPKTMSYAEPITVTLEGCKAKDLRYTDEAFYSIVVVSETEVQITLVGIVNDAGEVELIPVSRRLEICDCVSGEYVIIDIVDNNETTEPEIKADEEEEVDTPVEDIEKPEETNPEETKPEEKPETVVTKINAPETIAYAQTITITLEGIKAENLKFSNNNFLSIVIVSDSKVEVTLIGLVNDRGEVEFIPASGYITVTDSVSGVNAFIEIVEPEVTEENIFIEPEIENEEDEIVIDTPVEEVEKPEIPEDVPAVEVRIEAPEVMVYAEPIVIKLYGIKPECLKFSDEEFFSIVIISDNEVEVTLVGIVNDAGEVEFAPETGYITITDSVSGVHAIVPIA